MGLCASREAAGNASWLARQCCAPEIDVYYAFESVAMCPRYLSVRAMSELGLAIAESKTLVTLHFRETVTGGGSRAAVLDVSGVS